MGGMESPFALLKQIGKIVVFYILKKLWESGNLVFSFLTLQSDEK